MRCAVLVLALLFSAVLAKAAAIDNSGERAQRPWPTNGVNLSLFPSGLNRHDTAEVASEINRQRVDQAKSAGFGFIRLLVPFDAWTTKAHAAQQARVLTVAVATVQAAIAKDMPVDVVPQTNAATSFASESAGTSTPKASRPCWIASQTAARLRSKP